MGMYGAAISTAIGLIVGNVLMSLMYYKKAIGIQIGRLFYGLFHKLLIVIIITIIFGYYLNIWLSYQSWLFLITECLIITVFYTFMLYIWGLNGYEKKLVRKVIKIRNGHD